MFFKTTPIQIGFIWLLISVFIATGSFSAADERLPILYDKGIFPDLNNSVHVSLPPSINPKDVSVAIHLKSLTLSVLVRNIAVKTYPVIDVEGKAGNALEGEYIVDELYSENECPLNTFRIAAQNMNGKAQLKGCLMLTDEDAEEIAPILRNGIHLSIYKDRFVGIADTDADGIPDQVDVLMGAMKTDLDNAEYDDGFYPIARKMGDVPRNKGCCTDVVIRALRNAGIDLQGLLQRDIQKSRQSYSQITNPNSNIDHRRVRNLLVYFKRHFREIPLSNSEWMQGDIVLFDTLSKKGPDHIGIIAAERTPEGVPLVINAWTFGAVTDGMDLLSFVKVTHHFRVP
jgi:uncharacterized protein YijF (DUF1287 family)